MKSHVIIPSAKKVPIELEVELGAIPTALIPLGGKPVLKYLYDFYKKNKFKVLVSVQESKNEIIDYVESINDLKFTVVQVQDSSTLGNTIFESLNKVGKEIERLVINFADTLSDFNLVENDTIYFSKIDERYRWTTFKLDDEHNINQISERFNDGNSNTTYKIFTGIFIITRIEKFRNILSEILKKKEESGIDPFYLAIKKYFNSTNRSDKSYIELEKWFDCGHLDTYYKTRRNFYKRERIFNSISIDESRGLLIKKSTNKSKLINEINWYRNLPNELAYLSPRIYDFSIDKDDPFIKMEYYGYPVISDIYLFGSWNYGNWECFFKDLHFIINEMKKINPNLKNDDILKAQKSIYLEKTLKRLKEIKFSKELFKPFNFPIKINDTECLSIPQTIDIIPDLINATELFDKGSVSLIHGDLCFSNILYDQKNRIIRTIDPRGSFGELDIYGDIRYDYAKIQHSILGDYDFFVNGLFQLKWLSQKELLLKPNLKKKHNEIKKIYKKGFKSTDEFYYQIKLIEGLLFLSMVPLHNDKPKSQIAFLAKGILILSKLYNKILC